MPSVDDKIGEYILVEYIDSGGFGEVWKAQKPAAISGSEVALKFFRPKDERGVDLKKIKKEVETSQKLSGLPHIISVLEADIFKNYIYIVSEYANGGSLSGLIKKHAGRAESVEQALNITLEILKGLEYMHQQGIIHRDLKPENILIKKGIYCLADFGISSEIKTHSRATSNAGTYEYMPPEAFNKMPSVTIHTDIWATGVILQQLLTGKKPFPQEEIPSLISSILMNDPEKMSEDVPEVLHQIVTKALQKDRTERFQSAAEMRQALRDFQRQAVSAEEFARVRQKEIELQQKYQDDLERQRLEAEAKLAALEKQLEEIKQQAEREKIKLKQDEIKKQQVAKERAELDRQIASYREMIFGREEYLASAVERLKFTIGAAKFVELTERFHRELRSQSIVDDKRAKPALEKSDIDEQPQQDDGKSLEGRNEAEARRFYNRGFECDKNDFDGKITNYSKAIELKPDYADAYNNRGLAFYKKKNYDKAIKDYSRAVEIKPDFIFAFYHRAVAYLDKRDYDSAIKDFTKVIGLNSEYAVSYCNRGKAYLEKNEYDLAIKDFSKAIELQPRNFEAFNKRGVAYARKTEYEQAIKDYQRALELEPKYLEAADNLTLAYRALAEKNKKEANPKPPVNTWDKNRARLIWMLLISIVAVSYGLFSFCSTRSYQASFNQGLACGTTDFNCQISNYTQAINLKPDFTDAYLNRGEAYVEKQDFDSALKDFTKASELDSGNHLVYNGFGRAFVAKKEYDKAIADFTKAIEINAGFAPAYHGRGLAYEYKNEYEKAFADYEKTIQLESDYANAYFGRGNVYQFRKDYDAAIKDYNQVIRLKPESAEAFNNRGVAYFNKGDHDNALKDYAKATELNGKFSDPFYNRGFVYETKGNYSQAVGEYTKAIELNPNESKYFNARATAYERLNESAKARSDRKRFDELSKSTTNKLAQK